MNKRDALLQAMELLYALAGDGLGHDSGDGSVWGDEACSDLYDALGLNLDHFDDFAVLVTNALLGENQ